jgi:hypothetical protein
MQPLTAAASLPRPPTAQPASGGLGLPLPKSLRLFGLRSHDAWGVLVNNALR